MQLAQQCRQQNRTCKLGRKANVEARLAVDVALGSTVSTKTNSSVLALKSLVCYNYRFIAQFAVLSEKLQTSYAGYIVLLSGCNVSC